MGSKNKLILFNKSVDNYAATVDTVYMKHEQPQNKMENEVENNNLTYLGESKVRVTDPVRNTGAVLSVTGIVLRTLGVVAGEDTIIWYLNRKTNEIVPRKKKVKP